MMRLSPWMAPGPLLAALARPALPARPHLLAHIRHKHVTNYLRYKRRIAVCQRILGAKEIRDNLEAKELRKAARKARLREEWRVLIERCNSVKAQYAAEDALEEAARKPEVLTGGGGGPAGGAVEEAVFEEPDRHNTYASLYLAIVKSILDIGSPWHALDASDENEGCSGLS
eukprot:g546.t1